MDLKVEIVATNFIKPSSPNSDHPKTYKLALLDQLIFPENIPLVLYYPAAAVPRSSISEQLKKSLSTTLNHFYPFAGRINATDGLIDCSTNVSDGVPYKEANVAADLADLVAKRDPSMVWPLLPSKALFDEEAGTIPMQIQASFFRCGGMTIGICASHSVIDGVSYAEFLRSWATVSLGQGIQLLNITPPDLVIVRSLLPPNNLVKPPEPNLLLENNVVTKSFVFDGASIDALNRDISRPNYHQNQPTRVQVVLALLWKCMMKAVSSSTSSSSILSIFANMRTRLDPPLPQNSVGNFFACINIQKHYNGMEKTTDISLGELTDLQKFGLKDFCKKVNIYNKESDLSSFILEAFEEKFKTETRQDVDLFTVSSWCGFKFYELDFGWGKPTWISTNYDEYVNEIVLLDTKEGDGVEAWVGLKKEDMAAFEQDNELLSFASFSTGQNLSNGK